MNYRNYMKRIEDKIGEAKAADRIDEGSWWNIVVKELNYISNDCAIQLEEETGGKWNKGSYKLGLNQAPPTRLLALEIAYFIPTPFQSIIHWQAQLIHHFLHEK